MLLPKPHVNGKMILETATTAFCGIVFRRSEFNDANENKCKIQKPNL